jgi:hypothetical protein
MAHRVWPPIDVSHAVERTGRHPARISQHLPDRVHGAVTLDHGVNLGPVAGGKDQPLLDGRRERGQPLGQVISPKGDPLSQLNRSAGVIDSKNDWFSPHQSSSFLRAGRNAGQDDGAVWTTSVALFGTGRTGPRP